MPVLSAIIITKNEAANVADCLDSIAFCDEIIVVDCGSEDGTVQTAKGKGATVIHHAWTDYGTQKNVALSHATGEWVFSIDADERVSPALAAAIKSAIAEGRYDGYEMPRLSTFCDRTMRHSGWYPDYTLRLFRRGKGRFSSDPVHERVICDGAVGRLTPPLDHHPVIRIEDALRRMDTYSTMSAARLAKEGRRVWFVTAILRGAFGFIRTYFLRAGFLDGREGFLLAVLNAEGTYYRYMKLWLMNRNRGSNR
jgi:glycosyltransferase involved in cell wall biosynthesis